MRIERDVLGEKGINDSCYYGIYTARAIDNFPLTGQSVQPLFLTALAVVKQSCAEANGALRLLDSAKTKAISQAAAEIAAGKWRDQFPVDALQGGAGTSTNMNMNEVLANRALELLHFPKGCYEEIHPINHVNLNQSTNDVYPTALKIAAIWSLRELSEACAALQESLQKKEQEFAGIIKVGRTELQDAVPLMLGQEFGAFAQAIARDRWRIYKMEERLRQVNLGGTAVGTGLNADRKYIYLVIERLQQNSKIGLARAEDMIDATQNADVFVETSGLMKALAVNLTKIANDLRLLSSGPRTGLGEIYLPELQAGSSIMPGKVNPVIPEAVNQAAYQAIADDLAITLAAQAGQLELNAFLPLITQHLLSGIQVLTQAVRILRDKCIENIQPDARRCQALLDESLVTATALAPHIGYDAASQIAHEARETGQSIQEVAIKQKVATAEELDRWLHPEQMTRPTVKPGY